MIKVKMFLVQFFPSVTLVGALLSGFVMTTVKLYPHSFGMTWTRRLFFGEKRLYVVILQRKAKKCTKVNNAQAELNFVLPINPFVKLTLTVSMLETLQLSIRSYCRRRCVIC